MRLSRVLGRAVVVPPHLCPWYFQCIIMYAWHGFRRLAGTVVGAALLCEFRTCQAVLLQITPGALDGVRVFNHRTGGLPEEAALCFCCEGRSVLLRAERALCVPVCDDPPRSWHLELEVCIMRYRIESCKCGSPELCMITTAEHDYIKD